MYTRAWRYATYNSKFSPFYLAFLVLIIGHTDAFAQQDPTAIIADTPTSSMIWLDVTGYYVSGVDTINPTTTSISFTIPKHTHVRLQVFNVLGQLIYTLTDEDKEPGTYAVTWDAGDRPSGLYFYRMAAGEFVETKKMMVIR